MATSKTMSTNYRFRIADSYTPASLPMERLAEYMAALARLLGEPAHVHFDGVRAGSAVLAMSVDEPAQPIVRERIQRVQAGDGPQDALKAFGDLDELLRKDNATGELTDADNVIVLPFPGRNRPAPLTYGPFRQEGSLEGQLIRVGGKDETVPINLLDGDIVHTGLYASRALSLELSRYYLGPVIRVHGTGTWFREATGAWLLKSFRIDSFEVLDDAGLDEVVTALQRVEGSRWREVPDPVSALLEERHGNGGIG